MATEATAIDQFVQVNGLRIHYLDWGNSEAPPLIMLHGLRSFAHGWDDVAQALCDRYHILALDQRGRGGSDWDPRGEYRTEAYVSDLEGFIDRLGLGQFVLVGHSMGGANTVLYASRHPERVTAAVIEDIGPRSDPPAPGYARIAGELASAPPSFPSWTDAEAFLRRDRPGISEEALQRRVQNSFKSGPEGTAVWKYDLDGIRKAWLAAGEAPLLVDYWPHVRNLQCPTLVLRGARSDLLSAETAEAMATANPRIRWVEIPDAGHFIHEDNLPAFNREVSGFLDELR